DLLPAAATEPAAGSEPGRWTVTVDRLTIKNGALHARDEAVAPPAEWNVREVDADAYQMTTHSGAVPGRGALRGRIDEATLDVVAEPLRLDPLTAGVKITLDGFELRRLDPYLAQAAAGYRLKGGRLGAALAARVDHDADELTKAALSGTVSIEGES